MILARGGGIVVLLGLAIMIVACGLTPADGGLLAFVHLIDLVFHEAGHVLFGFFGRFLGVLGGSLNQVLIPAVCTGYFLWHRQLASAAVMLFWTGESLADVAIYVADGRDKRRCRCWPRGSPTTGTGSCASCRCGITHSPSAVRSSPPP